MYCRIENLTTRQVFIISAIFFLLYYSPFFFESLRIVTIHDNLDAEVVFNKLLGDFYHNRDALRLALNGNVPPYAFSRMYQPLSLLWAITDPWNAYMVTDIIVRIVAFIGVYLLVRYYYSSPAISALLAVFFSTSISYSAYLFTVSGIPILLYMILESEVANKKKFWLFLVSTFFISCNIALALSGVFLIASVIPILTLLCQEKLTSRRLFVWAIILLGLAVGNMGLLYAQLFDTTVWHRSDWDLSIYEGDISFSGLCNLLIKSLLTSQWYHVSYPLFIAIGLIIGLNIFCKKIRSAKTLYCIIALIFILCLYVFAHSPLSVPLRKIHQIFLTFQWDRFYFLYSTLIVVCLTFMFQAARNSKFLTTIMILGVASQIIVNLKYTPHIKGVNRAILNKTLPPSFNDYYMKYDFIKIKAIVKNDPVMSVGIDPMIAPMNGIVSIDGYYPLYPKIYKRNFREIIATSMVLANKEDYFDKWGNRVYVFYPQGEAETINFCAAQKIGARYVISNEDIHVNMLEKVTFLNTYQKMYLYKINTLLC